MADVALTAVTIVSSGGMMNEMDHMMDGGMMSGMDQMMGYGMIGMGFMLLVGGLLVTLLVMFIIWIVRQLQR